MPLAEQSQACFDNFWAPLRAALLAQHIPLLRIEQERGDYQFELVFGTGSPQAVTEYVATAKDLISEHAKAQGTQALFDAKPYAHQPASALHYHINLTNAKGSNVFIKTEEGMSDALIYALGGMLATIPLAMEVWCPTPASIARFDGADHIPRTLSWGVNNRYCALRIPMIQDTHDKRIEHRMAGADANPHRVMQAVLAGMLVGLEFQLECGAQEFGKPEALDVQAWEIEISPAARERFLELLAS